LDSGGANSGGRSPGKVTRLTAHHERSHELRGGRVKRLPLKENFDNAR
jgi:hypothetical protein